MPEEKSKNNNTALIVTIVILVVIILILCGGFGAYFVWNTSNKNSSSNVKVENEQENVVVENTVTEEKNNNITSKSQTNVSSDDAKASTIENPLGLNEWGLASKYVSKNLSAIYADTNYTDVPVRVTKVTRGDEATSIVKDWFDSQTLYKYEDPKAYTEWAVIDYEVDLSKLTFDEDTIGTSINVNSDVKGLDGLGIKYNDISYIVSTKDISDKDYVKEPGVYDCQFIVTLPVGCTDYVIKLGNSYNGSESYFKCE